MGEIPKVGSISLFSGSPAMPGPGTAGDTRDMGISFPSGTMLWLGGCETRGRAESPAPLGRTKGSERMKDRWGGNSALVSGHRGSI